MKYAVGLMIALFGVVCGAAPAVGPLRVSAENPRYFADGQGAIVYLTGMHTWANLQDQGAKEPVPRFDFDHYLDNLERYHHNLIRLWVWEQARWAPWSDGKGTNPSDWYVEPNPYARSGPGLALDGKPKFDLERFDEEYFKRLRERVKKSGERGIYVSIMLFQGWSSAKGWLGGKPWDGHPYNPKNNVQGFDGNPGGNSGPSLDAKSVREYHRKYLSKVIDTVNDLDNVLFEVTNEGGMKDWDWWVVDTVHQLEKAKPRQHPVGLTAHGSESNTEILASRADWFSPGSSEWPDLKSEPREAEGKKVSVVDTDHVWGVGGTPEWAWKVFMRGHNLLFMDPYDDAEWTGILAQDNVSVANADGVRKAMGNARKLSEQLNLGRLVPARGVASTGYCLAEPGVQYLVYQPLAGQGFSVNAVDGSYSSVWIDPQTAARADKGSVKSSGRPLQFSPPWQRDALLLLTKE